MDLLKNKIIESTSNIDNIINELKSIKGSLISIGSGGSKTTAVFASYILTKKNNCDAITLDPRDLEYYNKAIDNIFISSYSGSNYGVKSALTKECKKYLFSSRKTKIKDEVLLHYELEDEHSFISIYSTIIPMAILLKYYLEDEFLETINKIFESLKNRTFEYRNNYINIFSGIDSKVSEEFLESSLTESGLLIPLIHEKYSYCHGRSTINKDSDALNIYLTNRDTDLDKSIISVLDDVCVIDKLFDDDIVNEFYQVLECLIILKNLAAQRKIDLKKIDYNAKVVKKLYYFKGSM